MSKYSSRQHLIPCNKGGAHQGENAAYICVKKECLDLDPILCEVCRSKGHRNHKVIHIRDFFTQVTHRVNRQRIKDYANIQAVVDESERVCRESFENLKEYISQKLRVYDSLLQDQYSTWKENVSLFEEHHCLEVLSDIQQMQRETDITIFSSQVKRILPFVKFDGEEDGITKPQSTPYTNIKSITNDILGLPPLSRSEVYGFQQAFLNSLKKISENLSQQISSVSFGRGRGKGNASVVNVTTQQSRKAEESFISQLDANTTFLESATPVNLSRVKHIHQSAAGVPDISPVNHMSIIENGVHPNKNISQANNSNLQFYQNQQNQQVVNNKSYMTPRGNYRASDLLSFVKNSESGSKFQQHKRNNSAAQFSNQKQQQLQSFGGASNLNSTLPENNGVQVIDNFQKQVDDIQKSLDNLRNSYDFQKIIQNTADEKSPNRIGTNKNSNAQDYPINNIGSTSKQLRQSNIISNNNQQANFFSNSQQPIQSHSAERSKIIQGINLQNINNAIQTQDFPSAEHETNQIAKRNQNSNSIHQSIMNQSTVYSQQSRNQPQLSFSEKFQRFREMSKSLSRDNSLNNSYQRYRYDSNQAKQLQDEESEENRNKNLNNKKVKFYFSQDLKHEFVSVSKYIAQGQMDNYSTRLVLLEPTVEIVPHREITFSFLIKSCKNMEFGHPLAIGLCHKNIVQQNNFEFPQKEESINDKQKETISTAASGTQLTQHGCYLLTSSGFLRNHAYSKQDMKKVPVRFNTKDVIICHFNPFRKTLKFTKKSSGESCILNVDTIPNDKLYPCIRISYAQDCVEYIHE